jgi:hypothetical protein
MKIHSAFGQSVSPTLALKTDRVVSLAGSSRSLVRRSTHPSHASTRYPYSTNFSPPSQAPLSQRTITRARRPRHIPSPLNISRAITVRLKARPTSPHSTTQTPRSPPRPVKLPTGQWCPPQTKAGSPTCPRSSQTRNGSSEQQA